MPSDLHASIEASLEFPVMVHVGGKASMGIIEALGQRECVFRSLADFAAGATVEFSLSVRGAHVDLRGTIASVRAVPPRRYYTLHLGQLEPSAADALLRAIGELRAHRSVPVLEGGALARSSVRVPVDFAVGYAVDDDGIGNGSACDLSIGGMLMACEPLLPIGKSLEVTFTLPQRGAQPRRELTLKARLVAHQRASDGRWSNNLAFFNVEPEANQALAGFVEAAHAATAPT